MDRKLRIWPRFRYRGGKTMILPLSILWNFREAPESVIPDTQESIILTRKQFYQLMVRGLQARGLHRG